MAFDCFWKGAYYSPRDNAGKDVWRLIYGDTYSLRGFVIKNSFSDETTVYRGRLCGQKV